MPRRRLIRLCVCLIALTQSGWFVCHAQSVSSSGIRAALKNGEDGLDTRSASQSASVTGPNGPVNFSNVNVCPTGQSSPKPCSRTTGLTFHVAATTTFGTTSVVTQGVSNLDFTLSSTTCVGTLPAGSSCIVRPKFAPIAPGVRMGAVNLTDNSGNLLATTLIYGQGQGPVATFSPAPQITLPISGLNYPSALVVDPAGDIYIQADNNLVKFDPGTGVQTTIATGMTGVLGLALDGAGNLFVACPGNPSCAVVEIPAATGVQTDVGRGLSADFGIAVDGRGNLFITDNGTLYPRLMEVNPVTGRQHALVGGQYPDLPGIPLLNNPFGVAVDADHDVFVACYNDTLYELTRKHVLNMVSDFFLDPYTVAVDAAGDLFVGDQLLYELAAGTGALTVVGQDLFPGGIALDGTGNVFAATNNALVEVQSSQPQALNFGKVAVGTTSAPQSITIQNVGTQPLNAVTPGLEISPGFLQVAGTGAPPDCTATFSLAPGATCNLSIVFAPQAAGTINGTATFTDNALNKAPSANQTVQLTGIGTQ
jgi:Abnormal spindle-like microcephaly-assoc'd, ASPM-SPD-2-Hydin